MNIKQLRTFLAVTKCGSFAAAGDRLGLSHSAVSLQLKALEEELGVALFDRVKRPAVLTARGRALAEHAKETIALFEATPAVVRGDQVRGSLAVGAVPTALASFVPASLKKLQTGFPDLSIELRSGGSQELADRVAGGALDVAICTKPVNPIPGLDWHPISVEPFVVIAPAAVTDDTWRSIISGHPFLWFNRKTWAGQSIESELKAKQVHLQASMEVDSLEAISNLVSEGLGVSIVPICKGRKPFGKDIRTVPFGDPPFSREVGAFTSVGGRSDLVTDTFLSALEGED